MSDTVREAAPGDAPTSRCYVGSEVGRLRRVMLHRPGLELRRLTPTTARELLFDGVLWVGRAREEHDEFAAALAARGVEIVYLEDLLADVLEQPDVRSRSCRTSTPSCLGPTLGPEVRDWLLALPAADLADHLIAGVTFDELPFASDSIVARMGRGYVATPFPEHAVHARHLGVDLRRRVDQRHGDAGAHPRVAAPVRRLPPPPDVHRGRLRDLERPHASAMFLEGGDALVIGNGAVLVGMGERTHPAAVENLAKRLFAAEAATR